MDRNPQSGIGRSAHLTGKGGFTLIELVIVVFLMTLATGVITVAISARLPSAKVAAASRELAATLRRAKVLAQVRGEDAVVDFFPRERRYVLRGEGETTLAEGVTMVVLDPVHGEIEEDRWDTVFFAEGGARAASIRLLQDDHTATVRIDPIVGAELQ